MSELKIENLTVEVEGKVILRNVNLSVKQGEIHALMGPNGSGKTSLSLAIMGHQKYKIREGRILLDGEDITNLEPNEKVKRGLFLAFQNPVEIDSIKLSTLLVAEYNAFYGERTTPLEVLNYVKSSVKNVGLTESILNRGVFQGFSGGEKKRIEMAQMLLLKPKISILDEPDSGVDVDGLKIIADAINKLKVENNTGYIIITHYRRILDYVNPDLVHVLNKGTVVASGGKELARLIDEKGYEAVIKN
ncbi:Fe-S cluster assembly ATPase SufC [Sulfolobales archaeon HS-7]|nr:Fe-S cluster assembly ATPase SufC [Sulfolobales archaeon HS-7]